MAKSSVGGKVGLAVFALVVLGGVSALAYNFEDVQTWTALEGWNPGAAETYAKQFVKEAHGGGGKEMLNARWLQAVERGGKLVGIKHPGPSGPTEVAVRKIIPAADVKATASRIKYKAHAYEVAVQYPNGKWAALGVGREQGKFRIVSVPDDLTGEKPKPQPWD